MVQKEKCIVVSGDSFVDTQWTSYEGTARSYLSVYFSIRRLDRTEALTVEVVEGNNRPDSSNPFGGKPCVTTRKTPPLRLQMVSQYVLGVQWIEIKWCSRGYEVSYETECVTRIGEEHNRRMSWHKIVKQGADNRRKGLGKPNST